MSGNHSSLVDEFTIPLYPHLAEIFGTTKSFQILLRPDNYIGFISADTSAKRVETYLKQKIELAAD